MERKKIVLIGAGSAVFTKGLIADFIKAGFGSWEIALCDINPEILREVEKLAKKMVEQKGADIIISASTERKDLLPGADFVVTTIAVGGRRAWEQDVLIPRKYGIYQPVGDSIMPGGISRAQRMIPVMIDIAKDVEKYCPDAYFFNSQLDDTEIPHFMDNPLSWELYERLGGLPAVVDRHASEFFPERFPHGQFYTRTLGIDAFPIEEVIARGEKTYHDMLSQGDEVKVDEKLFERSVGEHEQLVEMIHSLIYDERKCFSVNIPNEGAVPGLPNDAVLELPGIATATGFRPLTVSDFPLPLKAIIEKRLAPVELTVQAALTGNRTYWEEAMMLDGAVTDYDTAAKLVDDFLEEFGQYLPQYKK